MNENEYSLIEKIIQKVVAMIYEPTYLLILIEIQKNKTYVTAESIVNATRLPMKLVIECLSTLKNENILEQFQNPESQGKYSKLGYIINYQKAIESIIYKYHSIIMKHQNSNIEEENYYICPFHRTKYSYEEALTFIYDGILECPECQHELQLETIIKGNESQKSLRIIQQLTTLKKELEMLKEIYHDIQDYPVMKKPEINDNKMNGILNKRKNNNENTNERINRIYSNQPMPWEEEEENKKEEMKIEIKEEIQMNEIEYSKYEFLQPNKTFGEIRSEIVPTSKSTSPMRSVEIYKPIKVKKARKTQFRSISATPQII